MKDVNTFDGISEEERPVSDFVTGDETENTSKATVVDPIAAERKRSIKCGIINTAISLGLNSIPIVIDTIRNKKQGIPNKINKTDIIRMAVTTAFPVLETIDAAFLNNNLSNKFHLKDVRNITNVVMTYPAAHQALNEFVNKTINNKDGEAQVVEPKTDALAKTWLGIGNIITPYITNKFTDENLTFMQKVNSAIPIPIIGRFIRTAASRNPDLQNIYQTGAGLISFAQGSSRALGNAVRAKPNSTINKATNTITNVADTIGDILGVSRNNGIYNNYGGGGYGYNSYGSRWGSYGSNW